MRTVNDLGKLVMARPEHPPAPAPGENLTSFPAVADPRKAGASLSERHRLADLLLRAAVALHHAERVEAECEGIDPDSNRQLRRIRAAQEAVTVALSIVSPRTVGLASEDESCAGAISDVCAAIRKVDVG